MHTQSSLDTQLSYLPAANTSNLNATYRVAIDSSHDEILQNEDTC